ncbi:MAG: hypothetical protein AAF206_15125 [Bacteroidota bacterium]
MSRALIIELKNPLTGDDFEVELSESTTAGEVIRELVKQGILDSDHYVLIHKRTSQELARDKALELNGVKHGDVLLISKGSGGRGDDDEITITLRDTLSGSEYDLTLSIDSTGEEIKKAFERNGYANNIPIKDLGLWNQKTGTLLEDSQTLKAAGIENGANFIIDRLSTFLKGLIAKEKVLNQILSILHLSKDASDELILGRIQELGNAQPTSNDMENQTVRQEKVEQVPPVKPETGKENGVLGKQIIEGWIQEFGVEDVDFVQSKILEFGWENDRDLYHAFKKISVRRNAAHKRKADSLITEDQYKVEMATHDRAALDLLMQLLNDPSSLKQNNSDVDKAHLSIGQDNTSLAMKRAPKDRWLKLMAKNKFSIVFTEAIAHYPRQGGMKTTHLDFVRLSGRWKSNMDLFNDSVINYQQYTLEVEKLRNNVLDLIMELD